MDTGPWTTGVPFDAGYTGPTGKDEQPSQAEGHVAESSKPGKGGMCDRRNNPDRSRATGGHDVESATNLLSCGLGVWSGFGL